MGLPLHSCHAGLLRKTIADFRRDNGPAIRTVCAQFVELCRGIGLFSQALGVIDITRAELELYVQACGV